MLVVNISLIMNIFYLFVHHSVIVEHTSVAVVGVHVVLDAPVRPSLRDIRLVVEKFYPVDLGRIFASLELLEHPQALLERVAPPEVLAARHNSLVLLDIPSDLRLSDDGLLGNDDSLQFVPDHLLWGVLFQSLVHILVVNVVPQSVEDFFPVSPLDQKGGNI